MGFIIFIRAVYLLSIIISLIFAYRIYILAPHRRLNRLGAATLTLTGIVAFIEHEISTLTSPEDVLFFDRFHTAFIVLLVLFASITGRVFTKEKNKRLRFFWGGFLGLLSFSGMVLIGGVIFTTSQFAYDFRLEDAFWVYNEHKDGFWAMLYQTWFIAAVSHLSFAFYRSYVNSDSIDQRRSRLVIFLVFSLVPFFLLYTYIIHPDEVTTGNYSISPFLIICNLGINGIFTDFDLFKINPTNAANDLLNSISSLVIILNPSLRIKFFNESFKREVGTEGIKNLDDVSLIHLLEWLEVDLTEIEVANGLAELKKGQQVQTVIMTATENGNRYFDTVVNPVFNSIGYRTGYIVVANEVTKAYQQEAALRAYNKELELSNQELERFAHIASHDLKSPLRNINSFVNLIERRLDVKKDPKLADYLRFVTNSVGYMYNLIQDILEYSTLSNRSNIYEQEVNLNHTLERIKETLAAQIEEGAIIHYQDLPTLKGNQSLFFQLFFNLIENGLKYNKKRGGKVDISYSPMEDSHLFKISDDGIGIEQKFKDRIFDMFSRLHTQDTYDGTGIGLAICKKIVHLYGGEIWLESEPGKGTSFYLELKK